MKQNRVGATLAFVLLAVVLMALPVGVKAQNDNNQWQSVDSLINKQYYTQAYEKAEKVYNKAFGERDSRQMLVGAHYLSKIGMMYKENSTDSSLLRLQRILPLLDDVDKAVCRLFLADFYASYFSQHTWRLSRNKATDEADLDYKLWDADRYRSVVYGLIREAFADTALMKSTPAESLGALVVVKEGKDGDMTPTVFDVAMYEVLGIVGTMPFPKLQQYDFKQPELLYSETDRFVGIKASVSNDTAKDCARYIFALMQQWERFCQGRENDGMIIERYCQRVNKLDYVVTINNNVARKYQSQELPKVIERYRNSNTEHITQLYALLAEAYSSLDKDEQAMAVIDTALSLYPDSPGGIKCYNSKQEMLQKNIQLEIIEVVPSTRHQLALVKTINIERVFFRIIKDAGCNSKSDTRKCMLNQKVLKQWSQDVEVKKKYDWQSTYIALPPLPQGDYVLMASPNADFKDEGIAFTEFSVEDVTFVPIYEYGGVLRGFLVDRVSGKPIVNHPVKLRQQLFNGKDKRRTLAILNTDKNGYYDFSLICSNLDDRCYLDVTTVWDGRDISSSDSYYMPKNSIDTNALYNRNNLFFDRPVYRPGDTVHFSYLQYKEGRREAEVSQNRNVMFLVRDINYKILDTIRLTTDEYGTCDGSYPLAANAIPGTWNIVVRGDINGNFFFRVEAYKQPKFTVNLTKPNRERRFGQMATVDGVAVSYSAVPIAGAKVAYEIERREMRPIWRWGWWNHPIVNNFRSVAVGELTTDEKGLFTIEFIPQPDSTVDFTGKPCFEYYVTAKVTDINGETHEAHTKLSVGFENSYVQIFTSEEDRDDVNVTVVHRNLDGNAVSGKLDFQVQRLQQPESPKITHYLMPIADSLANMPFSKKEFEKLFPLYDYDGSAQSYERWPVQKRIYNDKAALSPEKPYTYNMKGLKEGVYKFIATVRTDNGDTLQSESYIVYQPSTSRKPVSNKLITLNVDKHSCIVGDTVRLQIGSPYSDVECYITISNEKSRNIQKKLTVSEGYAEIAVPVIEPMLGGFHIGIAAVKENHFQSLYENVDVLWVHKQLDITLNTFRDKLEPGTTEQWTVSIREHDTEQPARANLLMTMYDHALDTYGRLRWNLNPWIQSHSSPTFSSIEQSSYGNYWWQPQPKQKTPLFYKYTQRLLTSGSGIDFIVATVAGVGYGTARGEIGMVTQSGNLRRKASKGFLSEDMEVTNELAVVDNDEEVVEYELALNGAQLQAAVVRAQKVPVIEVGTAESAQRLSYDVITKSTENTYIRQNLNTLAFFKPTLRTDDSGTVSFTFNAPDLLTEWNIQGTAWTKDLRVGTLAAKAITQKRLMVVPNVPRFLRQGDTCVFSAKVSNLDTKEQNVTVTLNLTTSLNSTFKIQNSKLTLQPNASGEVHFTFAVPEDVYLLKYKIVASGQGCSDGEQAPIPILPNRQLVTESMAFYINGKGTKQYELTHLTKQTQSHNNTLTHSSLTVDITPNPVWLAIQSLPYVSRQKNPSNIYLANAIYTNSLAFGIVQDNPQIEQLFAQWRQYGSDAFQSELDRNADLKQTVMEETPWLQDAKDEEQRHRDIANYFDKTALKASLSALTSQLLKAQRSDGGWSWIEGGRYSSLYTTQYILKTLGQLRQQGVKPDANTKVALNRAIEYIDRETYKYYQKYIKGKGYDVVNLDYLYLRSLYPDNKLSKRNQEAYDFFYNNAKKHNQEYTGLYTQAMLSLIFQRNGDTKLVTEMTKRIREKALYSDEMGLYWRDNVGGYFWNQRPIETQAMLIRTFAEVLGDNENVAKMQQWLLKQKQTTNWNTDVATVNAIQALLVTENAARRTENNSKFKIQNSNLTVRFGSNELTTDTTKAQLHISKRLNRDEITADDGRLTVSKADSGIAWGAMYWQYFEQIDKIPASSMGVTLKRTFYKVEKDNRHTALRTPITDLKVGDKVRVRIEIISDRTLEYLELKDPRCAALEPVSTASGWHWNGGLSYYLAVTNAAQTLYIDRLEKGKYVVEYDLYVNNAGTYTNAPTTIQCLYAPEFRALTPAESLVINGK